MAEETQIETTEPVETADAPVVEAPSEPEYKAHPAHEKLLSELPEAWHQKVLPHLQEQDKYFQQEIEKYAPYKEFAEQGISPDVLRGGVNLAKAIETQPLDVYESLTTYLKQNGLLAEEAQQAARQIMEEESGEDFDEIFDGEEKIPAALQREIDQLKQMTQEQADYLYNQRLEAETERELQSLERGLTELRTKYEISEAHEIAIYDIMNAAINAGRDITLEEAAQQLASMIPGGFQAVNRSNAEPAPTVIGSAGGAGIQAQNLEVPKDDDAKRAMLEKMFQQYKNAAQ